MATILTEHMAATYISEHENMPHGTRNLKDENFTKA